MKEHTLFEFKFTPSISIDFKSSAMVVHISFLKVPTPYERKQEIIFKYNFE